MLPSLAAAKFNLNVIQIKYKHTYIISTNMFYVLWIVIYGDHYLPVANMLPLQEPNVDMATDSGTIHTTLGITISAHVWNITYR